MKKTLIKLGIGCLLLLGAYSAGRWAQPAKVITKEVQVVKKDVRTVVRTIKQPDGTVIRERTTEDKTVTSNEKNSKIESNKPAWKVNALVGYSFDSKKEEYGIMVQKNYVGPVNLGVYATTAKTVGVTLGFEF